MLSALIDIFETNTRVNNNCDICSIAGLFGVCDVTIQSSQIQVVRIWLFC